MCQRCAALEAKTPACGPRLSDSTERRWKLMLSLRTLTTACALLLSPLAWGQSLVNGSLTGGSITTGGPPIVCPSDARASTSPATEIRTTHTYACSMIRPRCRSTLPSPGPSWHGSTLMRAVCRISPSSGSSTTPEPTSSICDATTTRSCSGTTPAGGSSDTGALVQAAWYLVAITNAPGSPATLTDWSYDSACSQVSTDSAPAAGSNSGTPSDVIIGGSWNDLSAGDFGTPMLGCVSYAGIFDDTWDQSDVEAYCANPCAEALNHTTTLGGFWPLASVSDLTDCGSEGNDLTRVENATGTLTTCDCWSLRLAGRSRPITTYPPRAVTRMTARSDPRA